VTARLTSTAEDNPLTTTELADGYLLHLEAAVGPDQQYNSKLWLHVSPKTTRLYTHFNQADSQKRMEFLDIRF
jgi:hypothetical protein